ncbi:2-amino-4-hydroxy-6-hydroxymethyldihydropteridine diphosphokinase [Nocardioides convexus]|uniref:2-amino-4-hydroxy-6- hydroxymethyldihydropteridine diphosphokinase n=1 Tax=Nocardioides convexus TaxID=2712224 RepID=UPI00241878B9|nr:2-amino-4-hydroxy-6-hydroxymethyldihydropteridine diphosphokinase [Nocardioides convexus]
MDALADTPNVWVTGVSPVYESAPVDCPEGSQNFLNAVVLADTTLSAHRLIDRALAIEDAFDRLRGEAKNSPRTLDVDLIVVGDRRSDKEEPAAPAPARPRACLRAQAVARPRAGRGVPRPRAGRRPAGRGRHRRPDPAPGPGPRARVSAAGDPGGEPPSGSLRPTSLLTLVGWAVVGGVLGWALHPVADRLGVVPPLVTAGQPLALGLLAAILGYVAWVTYRAVHVRRERLEAHQAVNRLVLARACALVGALVAGGYVGYALSLDR